MLRRSPIFIALEPSVVSSGLQPDKHSASAILWEAAENVTFYSGKVRRRTPSAPMFTAGTDPVRGLHQQQVNNGTRWVWAASGGRIVRWYGPAPEQIVAGQPWNLDETVLAKPTFWDFTGYGDWTIFNNGQSQPKIYKPGTGVVNFGDNAVVLGFIKKLQFVMAIGTGPRGNVVSWPYSQNIEQWGATEDNDAGDLTIDDFNTRIRSYCALGQSIAVYSEDQMALVTYTGQPFYFGQRVVLQGIGAIGKMAVAGDGRLNFGVGRNGVWQTDGVSSRYIDEGFLRDYLQEQVNWDQGGKIWAAKNDYTGCFEFGFPMRLSTVVNEVWSYDPRTGGWSPIPAFELKQERRLFSRMIAGTNDGLVRLDQNFPEAAGALLLRSKPMLMQAQSAEGHLDAHSDCRVDEIELLCKAAINVQVRIGCSQESLGVFEWSQWQTIDILTSTYRVDQVPDGVYWKLEFQSTADNWDLDLQGFMLYGQVDGVKRR